MRTNIPEGAAAWVTKARELRDTNFVQLISELVDVIDILDDQMTCADRTNWVRLKDLIIEIKLLKEQLKQKEET